jgi:hypothetical protein
MVITGVLNLLETRNGRLRHIITEEFLFQLEYTVLFLGELSHWRQRYILKPILLNLILLLLLLYLLQIILL